LICLPTMNGLVSVRMYNVVGYESSYSYVFVGK
jgi:hypothetical protein